jgi:putative ABC transport system permease protein
MGGTMATELSRLSSTGRVGRNFLGNDTTHKCLINETLLRVLGYGNPDDVLGMQLNKEYTVTGVVKDYHAMSLHSVIKPALIHSWYQHNGFHIKLATTNGTVHRV